MENRKYRITKSIVYTEAKKHLFISYNFEYFNEKRNKWRETINTNTCQSLKDLAIEDPSILGIII